MLRKSRRGRKQRSGRSRKSAGKRKLPPSRAHEDWEGAEGPGPEVPLLLLQATTLASAVRQDEVLQEETPHVDALVVASEEVFVVEEEDWAEA